MFTNSILSLLMALGILTPALTIPTTSQILHRLPAITITQPSTTGTTSTANTTTTTTTTNTQTNTQTQAPSDTTTTQSPTTTTTTQTPTDDQTPSNTTQAPSDTSTAPTSTTSAPATTAPATAPATTSNTATATPTFPGDAAEQAAAAYILQQYNQYRQQAGVAPLTVYPALSNVSYAHSQEMQQTGVMQHNSVNGQTPCQRITAAGITWHYCEENIAWNRNYSSVQAGIQANLNDMMAEPLNQGSNHHTNIISPNVSQIGIGVSIVGNNVYWTTDFIGN